MANAKLAVTISDGSTDLTIYVDLYKDSVKQEHLEKQNSFTQNFTSLTSGSYTLFVFGINPPGGNTVLSLSGNGVTITKPSSLPVTKKGISYQVEFRFTI
jgi:hypothetical protein